MKLTQSIRDAFVRAAIADVPHEDYREQARPLALKAAIDALPPKVREVYDDQKTRGYVKMGTFCYCSLTVSVPMSYEGFTADASLKKKIDALLAKEKTQKERDQNLRAMLKGAAYSVTTRKALAELLPEFEKYLPADDTAAKKAMLPAVANIATEFMKAGWPKKKQPAMQDAA